MFQWDKSVDSLGASVDKVLHLLRSMRALQLTLPGMPVQQATAYLCQYKDDGGVVSVAVFHLEKSNHLAFYYPEARLVDEQEADGILDEGMHFVESMGFLLADLDLHLLEADDQEMLWESLPLRNGIQVAEASEPAAPVAPAAGVRKQSVSSRPASPAESAFVADAVSELTSSKKATEAKPAKVVENGETPAEEVDDLLAAVAAMRANRPGLRARKMPPPAEELTRRRTELRENIGRILASL